MLAAAAERLLTCVKHAGLPRIDLRPDVPAPARVAARPCQRRACRRERAPRFARPDRVAKPRRRWSAGRSLPGQPEAPRGARHALLRERRRFAARAGPGGDRHSGAHGPGDRRGCGARGRTRRRGAVERLCGNRQRRAKPATGNARRSACRRRAVARAELPRPDTHRYRPQCDLFPGAGAAWTAGAGLAVGSDLHRDPRLGAPGGSPAWYRSAAQPTWISARCSTFWSPTPRPKRS